MSDTTTPAQLLAAILAMHGDANPPPGESEQRIVEMTRTLDSALAGITAEQITVLERVSAATAGILAEEGALDRAAPLTEASRTRRWGETLVLLCMARLWLYQQLDEDEQWDHDLVMPIPALDVIDEAVRGVVGEAEE